MENDYRTATERSIEETFRADGLIPGGDSVVWLPVRPGSFCMMLCHTCEQPLGRQYPSKPATYDRLEMKARRWVDEASSPLGHIVLFGRCDKCRHAYIGSYRNEAPADPPCVVQAM